jgi:hypothetical protein
VTNRSTDERSETSHRVEVIDGSDYFNARRASSLMSQTCTFAPSASKPRAIANPIPLAAAVIRIRFPVCILLITVYILLGYYIYTNKQFHVIPYATLIPAAHLHCGCTLSVWYTMTSTIKKKRGLSATAAAAKKVITYK